MQRCRSKAAIRCTLEYIPRILQRRLNIFHVFSEYAERLKNTRRKNEEYTVKTFHLQQFLGL